MPSVRPCPWMKDQEAGGVSHAWLKGLDPPTLNLFAALQWREAEGQGDQNCEVPCMSHEAAARLEVPP
eukprot:1269186-Karenia_brevis.AAC.1